MTEPLTYRALAMLENEHEPKLRRRSPYWRPRPAPCWRDVHLPAWNWTHPLYHAGLRMDLTLLDANAAFLSAASSASFAHGELERTGALSAFRKLPGYYRIDAHSWQDERIVSPLGSAETGTKVWVMHSTVEYLLQLTEAGVWPGVDIHDSWTCPDSVRLRSWATAVNNDRAAALRARDTDPDHDPRAGEDEDDECECRACTAYESIKLGYSQAVQLMRGPAEGGKVKSGVKRPDWHDTIHAQHAASTHRQVWNCLRAGFEPVMMGSVDEVVWPTETLAVIRERELMKLDDTGVQLGHFKVKERIAAEVHA